jgi:hypothetical protein
VGRLAQQIAFDQNLGHVARGGRGQPGLAQQRAGEFFQGGGVRARGHGVDDIAKSNLRTPACSLSADLYPVNFLDCGGLTPHSPPPYGGNGKRENDCCRFSMKFQKRRQAAAIQSLHPSDRV